MGHSTIIFLDDFIILWPYNGHAKLPKLNKRLIISSAIHHLSIANASGTNSICNVWDPAGNTAARKV